jgi:regulator of protease activity HflC (stomatin/prohibitin superfamily)
MFFFVIGIILILAGLATILVGGVGAPKGSKALPVGVGIVIALVGGGAWLTQTFYSQDSGEASVIVDASGQIVGQETTPGFHGKLPWQSVKTFNIRNQTVSFVGQGKEDYTGGSAQGPQVTAQDADGVSNDIDVNLVYSIDPTKVTEIYKQYRDEDNFVKQFVVQQVRSITRNVPNQFSTIDLLTKRADVQVKLTDALETTWAGSGVHVTQVNLQEIRPPQSIKDSYSAAQQAQVQVTAEKAKLQATQVSAQQQVVQAKAQAEANKQLNSGLTDRVLQSRYIDALKEIGEKGNLVVVPAGSNPNIYTGKK